MESSTELPQSPPHSPSQSPPSSPPSSPTEARRAAAVLALARFETRELFLQIPVLFFLALYIALVVWRLAHEEGMNDFPILNMVDRDTQESPLLLGIALLVCVNSATLRSRKNGTVQQFDVLAMDPWRRTLAHVLSVVPFAALTAVAVGAEFTRAALKPGAIGHGSFGELALGPLSILASGVLGVLLARLAPSPLAAMVFVVAGYLLVITASASVDEGGWAGWLSPTIFGADTNGDPVPSDLIGRPAAWHALYVAALCVLLACAALLLSGGRNRAVKTAGALALAATVAGAIGQYPRDASALDAARRTASETPQKVQSCTTYDGSTYCSFPEWSVVRSDWADVVDRVQSLAGGAAAKAPLTVRQRVDLSGGIESDSTLASSATPQEVTVGTRWGGNRVPEFAVGVASVVVMGTEAAALDACDARNVTTMWLALGADPTPLQTFKNLRLDDSTEGSGVVLAPTNPLSLTARQTAVVRELLDRPRADVTARVKAHWTELTSANTTTAEAAKLLGVPVPEEAEKCEE
ncbi:ABC transporter permease [Streptomyces sp. NBC_01275]|uniref:ABC transporter permease n=1 Tax=Streptomyces sp. NBC_01275 TaxID=2903807 RepID=UPI00224FFDA7|nr:ABC transporter permease [Streptomyces sp. NBC_01275]MCX4763162.1 ABC transporter permease [Streptomyces sp. NBC_01275]